MSACTVSHLALDAGVSVHVVRDYVLRGLLRPVERTNGAYCVFDRASLQRLRFVRAAFEAGIGLGKLAWLCHALDTGRRRSCVARPSLNEGPDLTRTPTSKLMHRIPDRRILDQSRPSEIAFAADLPTVEASVRGHLAKVDFGLAGNPCLTIQSFAR